MSKATSWHQVYWNAIEDKYRQRCAKAERVCRLADQLILGDKETKKFTHLWIDMQEALHEWRGKPRKV